MNENPGDNLNVVRARSCGQMIALLQGHHDKGNRHRSIAAADGYLNAITIWLQASVGAEVTFNVLNRQLDAVTAAGAEEKHLQEQG